MGIAEGVVLFGRKIVVVGNFVGVNLKDNTRVPGGNIHTRGQLNSCKAGRMPCVTSHTA